MRNCGQAPAKAHRTPWASGHHAADGEFIWRNRSRASPSLPLVARTRHASPDGLMRIVMNDFLRVLPTPPARAGPTHRAHLARFATNALRAAAQGAELGNNTRHTHPSPASRGVSLTLTRRGRCGRLPDPRQARAPPPPLQEGPDGLFFTSFRCAESPALGLWAHSAPGAGPIRPQRPTPVHPGELGDAPAHHSHPGSSNPTILANPWSDTPSGACAGVCRSTPAPTQR